MESAFNGVRVRFPLNLAIERALGTYDNVLIDAQVSESGAIDERMHRGVSDSEREAFTFASAHLHFEPIFNEENQSNEVVEQDVVYSDAATMHQVVVAARLG